MPWKLNDPAAVPQHHSPIRLGASADITEAMDISRHGERLNLELGELRPIVEANAAREEAAATEAVNGSPEARNIPSSFEGVRQAYGVYRSRVQAANANRNLSVEGKAAEVSAAKAVRDAAVVRVVEAGPSTQGDSLLARFANTAENQQPSTAIAQECALIYTSFGAKTPATFASESLATLRRAVDPATPPAERYRGNLLLIHAFGPLCRRRADAPEKHARALQPLNAALADAIDLHLHTVWQVKRHELAVQLVSDWRRQFEWVVRNAEQRGEFDAFLVPIGAPLAKLNQQSA